MEVSSVALKLHRVRDIRFSQGIFTGFSGDHLDFHGTMEDYFQSKLMLFENLGMDDWAVVNVDDPNAAKVLEQLDCKYLTYGFSEDADVRPKKYKFTLGGIQASIKTPKGVIDIKSTLLGRVNLSNIMAAVTSAVIKGISFDTIAEAAADFKPAKGRMDIIYRKRFAVMIDYAHTDNALESMLISMKEIVPERIILVFGAGGSRDKTKRPRMGEVASKHADVVVLTSDNPRQEDPDTIINDVAGGFENGFKDYLVEADREKAIEEAIRMADSGDLVVIAGKGHEDYQVFKDRTIHFDDYEVAQKILDTLEKEKHA
jgi:UDP-N-acetylmuramoyl-L-alanyl-D-glutamate--2,6-diaminopimelate ligase